MRPAALLCSSHIIAFPERYMRLISRRGRLQFIIIQKHLIINHAVNYQAFNFIIKCTFYPNTIKKYYSLINFCLYTGWIFGIKIFNNWASVILLASFSNMHLSQRNRFTSCSFLLYIILNLNLLFRDFTLDSSFKQIQHTSPQIIVDISKP